MNGTRQLERGFSLVEAIVALVLMGLVLSALGTITAQWLPAWHRGLDRAQRNEVIGIALQRIAADVSAAEYVPPHRQTRQPLFDGSQSSVTFVRTALGPNAGGPGLDVVRIGMTDADVAVRWRARFTPLAAGASVAEQVDFRNPVRLLDPPLRLSFAYAGPDRIWNSSWRNHVRLPAMIRLTISDAAGERARSISTVARMHVQVSTFCLSESAACGDNNSDGQNEAKPGAQGASQ